MDDDERYTAARVMHQLRAKVAELEAENFRLSAGVCDNLVGDPWGHPTCEARMQLGRVREWYDEMSDCLEDDPAMMQLDAILNGDTHG